MKTLAERALSLPALEEAWREVLANDLDDGEQAQSVARFAEDSVSRLCLLAEQLASGCYEPHNLVEVSIPSGDSTRTLHIPSVRDRVVARALLEAITPLVDPHLGCASFGYRFGLGVSDAAQHIVGWRAAGYTWVARTDVEDCFPTVPRELALRRVAALISDDILEAVLHRLGQRAYRTRSGSYRVLDGLPQGCPLSPLLANLVLVDVDDALMHEGFPVVRYGDDLCIAAHSRDEALEALRVAHRAIKELGMELGADKTATMSFAEGFAFLGEDFGPRYPPDLANCRVREPDEKVVYAGVQGGRVRVAQGRLIVSSKDNTDLVDVPMTHVGRVVCFGSVGLSAGARSWALGNDVDVVFASRSGHYQGTLTSDSDATRPARLRAQLEIADTDRAMVVGRCIIVAKIAKQRVMLQRANRRDVRGEVADAIGQLDQLSRLIDDATTPMELMGLEGAAARFYFPCLGSLMPEGLRFTERSRRPPMDVANAALSYLYTILLGEAVTALRAAGLDPSIGILHSEQDNRPSLALDLIEEFRPLIVDQVVLRAAQRGTLQASHARSVPGRGILLTKAGKEVITDAYERRMLQESRALPGFSGTLRRHLYRQAQRLRAAIMDPSADWTGLSWR